MSPEEKVKLIDKAVMSIVDVLNDLNEINNFKELSHHEGIDFLTSIFSTTLSLYACKIIDNPTERLLFVSYVCAQCVKRINIFEQHEKDDKPSTH